MVADGADSIQVQCYKRGGPQAEGFDDEVTYRPSLWLSRVRPSGFSWDLANSSSHCYRKGESFRPVASRTLIEYSVYVDGFVNSDRGYGLWAGVMSGQCPQQIALLREPASGASIVHTVFGVWREAWDNTRQVVTPAPPSVTDSPLGAAWTA